MSPRTTIKIALAFVGLIIGAGFATGREVVQYFVSFGTAGLWGVVIAGLLMSVAGAVIIQFGSYFLAHDHNMVFRNVAHPVISVFLDVAVTITLFAVGIVMLAGAGSTLEQQFGLPAWIGAGIMVLIVAATGMLDVDKVSSIISGVTPLIIVAVIAAFAYTMANLPTDFSGLDAAAMQAESPVQPWWLSAVNYTGLSLLLGVSMCLVIGGNYPNPREAGWGGLAGGVLYTVLLLMSAIVLFCNFPQVGEADIPMLQLFESINPIFALVMVFIIFGMIYNTAIGMFYALGRRLTATRRERYRPVFLATCLAGYAVSFVGFDALMNVVYPAIGYIGMLMILVMIVAWVRRRAEIGLESGRRQRMKAVLLDRVRPGRRVGGDDEAELEKSARESNVEDEAIVAAMEHQAAQEARRGGRSASEPREAGNR